MGKIFVIHVYIYLPCDPGSLFLGIFLRKMKNVMSMKRSVKECSQQLQMGNNLNVCEEKTGHNEL